MIERFESPLPVDSRVIERLVDGELTASEERSLLAAIDFQPDGWRRCALAFLEARAWKGEFAEVTRGDSGRVNGAPVAFPSHAADQRTATSAAPLERARWTGGLAIAASIGLAFLLGIAVRGSWSGAARNQLAVATDEDGTGKASRGSGNSHAVGISAPAAVPPTITMTVVDNQGGIERQLEIPVVETDTFDPRWLQRPPSAIPRELASALRRNGHSVEEQRLYVPVRLDDGRQAIIPLDQAEVRFVGASY
jgi:hypothetical protein